MYINSINNNGADYTLSSFGNIIVCSNDINDVKTVTFPNGFVDTNPEPYLTFQVLFVNGHNCVDSTTYMTLNDYNVMVNKDGTLINLPIHKFTESSDVVYKSLQANTILNLFFDGTQFVVIGNPIVLSSTDYIIYANGKIGDGDVGDYKAISSENIPYGWLPCDGRAVSRTEYSALFNVIGTSFGNGDTINTFNVPDLRECVLVGIGTRGSGVSTHDTYNLGQFKDDQLQGHKHAIELLFSINGAGRNGGLIGNGFKDNENVKIFANDIFSNATNGSPRVGSTTHGKQLGVNYIIKY